jgi:hypothetical protein
MELAIYFESLGVLTVEQVPEYSFGDIVGREIFSHSLFRIIDWFFMRGSSRLITLSEICL